MLPQWSLLLFLVVRGAAVTVEISGPVLLFHPVLRFGRIGGALFFRTGLRRGRWACLSARMFLPLCLARTALLLSRNVLLHLKFHRSIAQLWAHRGFRRYSPVLDGIGRGCGRGTRSFFGLPPGWWCNVGRRDRRLCFQVRACLFGETCECGRLETKNIMESKKSNQPINQSTEQSFDKTTNQSINQSTYQLTELSVN